MPEAALTIYCMEKAYPLNYICENTMGKCYVVGMHCVKGRFDFAPSYTFRDGEFTKVEAPAS